MPITGDLTKLRSLQKAAQDLARRDGKAQTAIAKACGRAARELVKEQFRAGLDPYGQKWAPLHRRKQASPAAGLTNTAAAYGPGRFSGRLPFSRTAKLPNSFAVRAIPGGFVIYSKVPWIRTHQRGHVYPARQAGPQRLVFNRRGRLVSFGRARRLRRVREVIARRHTVGVRVLPARPLLPEPVLGVPSRWGQRFDEAATEVLRKWQQESTKG